MTPEEGYREAEIRIAEAQRSVSLKLDLVGLRLTKIPPQIANLRNLQILSLDSNQIVEISDAITNLQYLQTLSLSNNQIFEIPDSIANLQYLQ